MGRKTKEFCGDRNSEARTSDYWLPVTEATLDERRKEDKKKGLKGIFTRPTKEPGKEIKSRKVGRESRKRGLSAK